MRKLNRVQKRRVTICLIAAAIMTVALLSVTLAKYVSEQSEEQVLVPSRFSFFCSCEDGATYGAMEGEFTFTVSNHSDFAVDYTVSVSSGESDVTSGYLDKDETKDITVTFSEQTKITVKTTSPYVTTRSFTVKQAETGNYYTLADCGNWLQLDLFIGAEPSDITIDYGALSPDTLNDLMVGWKNAEQGILAGAKLHAYAHYTLIFFENDEESKAVYKNVEEKTEISSGEITIEKAGDDE